MRRLIAAALALSLSGPLAAASQGPAEALDAANARLAAAASAQPADVDALAAALSGQAEALADLRAAVLTAGADERALTIDLRRRRDETTQLLAALQALSRTPSGEGRPMLHPQGPLAAARAASMLERLTPELQARARMVSGRLADIEEARALRSDGLAEIAAGLDQAEAGRAALLAALSDRPVQEAAPSGPEALARDAESLTALAEALAGDAEPVAEPLDLAWPVAGVGLRGFEEPDAAGVRRPGLLVFAPPLAMVAAPADGTVLYAGPFLDYTYVVALEPRPDTLILLAGLADLETETGAVVRRGEPLGFLGGRRIDAQEYLMLGEAGIGETPDETLYIELRHGQGPIDPAPWFGDRNG